MEIVYAAHTESGVFMLDGQGICRWAVAPPGRTHAQVPERIVGAQYVATLDLASSGGLVDMPRAGCPMLFAHTDEDGKIRLVRTQPVLRFEDKRNGTTISSPPPANEDATPVVAVPVRPSAPPSAAPMPLLRPLPSSALARPISSRPLGSALVRTRSSPPGGEPIRRPLPPPPAVPGQSVATLPPPPPRAHAISLVPPPRRSVPPSGEVRAAAPAPRPLGPRLSDSTVRTNGIPSTFGTSNPDTGIKSIPVRVRSANLSLRRLARGR